MVIKQNVYKNTFLMNLKACLDNSEFQNIIHWANDNIFKIENLNNFIKESKDKFKSKNLFLRNLRDFCFNILKNNSNGKSLYHAQFKKGITAEEIKRIKKKRKKKKTYSFKKIKSKLLRELEKEKEETKNCFNVMNSSENNHKYDTLAPTEIQMEDILEKYRATSGIRDLKILNIANN